MSLAAVRDLLRPLSLQLRTLQTVSRLAVVSTVDVGDHGDELAPRCVAHQFEPAEPLASRGLAGLHRHPNAATIAGFDDEVDFGTISILPVEQRSLRRRPAELAAQLGEDDLAGS